MTRDPGRTLHNTALATALLLAGIRQGLEQAGFVDLRLMQTGGRVEGLVEAFRLRGRSSAG